MGFLQGCCPLSLDLFLLLHANDFREDQLIINE